MGEYYPDPGAPCRYADRIACPERMWWDALQCRNV